MQWYQDQKIRQETGGDLSAYRQKILDEAMKDPAFQAKVLESTRTQAQAAPSGNPNIKLPPSISRLPGSGVSAAELDGGDMTDASLFKYATAPGRR